MLLLWAATSSVLAADMRFGLPTDAFQGSLLIGRAPAGSRVWLDARSVRVSDDGLFLVGIGRDRRDPLQIEVESPTRTRQRLDLAVTPRDWPRERIDGLPPKTVSPPPEIAQRIAREQAAVAAVRERDDARSDFAQGFIWPLQGRISGRFGSARVYNGQAGAPHSGLDLAAATGTPVAAPAAGVISFAEPDLYLTGGTVVLDHGHGLSSVFLHLSRIDVAVGQRVEAGEIIAAVGATGRASGPHLHWGINLFEQRLDPEHIVGLRAP